MDRNESGAERADPQRRQRLLRTLTEGREGRPVPAVVALRAASALLQMGETLGSLRQRRLRIPKAPALDERSAALIGEAQRLYAFDPRAWRLLGVDLGGVDLGGVDLGGVDLGGAASE